MAAKTKTSNYISELGLRVKVQYDTDITSDRVADELIAEIESDPAMFKSLSGVSKYWQPGMHIKKSGVSTVIITA